MIESQHKLLRPRRTFLNRLVRHALGAVAFLLAALWIGMAGHHWLDGSSRTDSFVNAARILGGVGPVAELHTTAGRSFAGAYPMLHGS